MVDNINTYDDLQQLINTSPDVFFDNLCEISSKFPLYLLFVKFPNDVILKYVNNGLNPLDLLITQNLTGYIHYYVRSLYYGQDRVDEMYSDIKLLNKNNDILRKRSSVPFDDDGYESNVLMCESIDFMW